ncbi:hypothetical protein GCM10011386_14170 [Parapedobacter defluvii]|uniref:Response regulatory domain-containing protein n=1 Tax=Parapedobacter defluvii TaxID=2045106 RepID=A0ABQ1LGL1_9SPHI|nr:response regulator [Parapedobacter defluvii]GGC23420.1 hypothetical protein GCM10011386_14170 [Parapedobacter defluvii]
MGKKILIVDDDAELQFLLVQILGDAGYETCNLLHGESVLETTTQFAPDLILLDVKIGNMDGRSLCKHIKQTPGMEAIPIILVSAADGLYVSLDQEGGPDDIILKPFDLDNFLKKIAFFLT